MIPRYREEQIKIPSNRYIVKTVFFLVHIVCVWTLKNFRNIIYSIIMVGLAYSFIKILDYLI